MGDEINLPWLCRCGKWNSEEEKTCRYCGKPRFKDILVDEDTYLELKKRAEERKLSVEQYVCELIDLEA